MENRDLIKRAVDYAMAHAGDEDITVQTVAEHAGFSIDYFNRLFLSHTGFTVMAYVGYRRLKKGGTVASHNRKIGAGHCA